MKKIPSILFVSICFALFQVSIGLTTGTPLLKNISFKTISDFEEQIIFQIDATEVPSFFAIKGDNPRVVFDFPNTTIGKDIKTKIETNGKYVKRIRVGLHKGPEQKVRVVFDMNPNEKINVKKIFNKDQKNLTVTIGSLTAPANQKKEPPVVNKSSSAGKPITKDPFKNSLESTLNKNSDATMSKPQASPSASSTTPLLSSITFDKSSNRGEMVLFKLNEFYPPVVFGIEEELPRVVCDFIDTTMTSSVPAVLKCDGQFVKAVRTGAHKNPNKIRVVLDLSPHNNYDLQQVFFKEDNLFVLIINKIENVRNPEEKAKK